MGSITLALSQKVAQLFLIMVAAFLIVRLKIVKAEDSKILSKVVLYIVNPCLHINAFQISLTDESIKSFGFALVSAFLMTAIFFAISYSLKKPLKLVPVEQASIIYSNQGNLLMPIVASILGSDKLIYMCGFMLIQLPLVFSHGRMLLGGEKEFSFKKIFGCIGMIDIFIGFFFYVVGIKLPTIVVNTFSSVEAMAGPLCMIIAGMTLGGIDLKKTFSDKRLYMTTFIKLFINPMVIILLIWGLGLNKLLPGNEAILYICVLCASAPAATSIISISQVYGGDSEYGSRINVLTTLLCIGTIPLMMLIYESLMGII